MKNARDYFVAPTNSRLLVMRKGASVITSRGIPKPIVLIDKKEEDPFPLQINHPNWIAEEKRMTLKKTGDYTVEGMEEDLRLERKSLAELGQCTKNDRAKFIASCALLARFKWKAILIECTLEDIKRSSAQFVVLSGVHPNAVCGTLDAVEAKFGIPIILTSTNRALATERAASWLSKHFTYWWLEKNKLRRVLIDTDQL